MRNVIFLDIDGVLNGYGTVHKIGQIAGVDYEKIAKLRKIVRYIGGAELVLTSSWKEYWTPELKHDGVRTWKGSSNKRYGRYLNLTLEKFGLEISDKTDEEHWTLRALGILEWLDKNPDVDNYIILDDEDFHWSDYQMENHWIDTDDPVRYRPCGEGLKDKHVEEVKRRFDEGKFRNERKH